MAAYITDEELTPPGVGPSFVEELPLAVRDAARESSSREADTYLTRWGTPIPQASVSSHLKTQVRAIAIYRLLSDRGFDPELRQNAIVVQNFQDAIRWLEKCAAGRVNPLVGPDATPSVEEAAPTVTSDEPRGW